jgi:TetR/AcrR family transcriptional regulator, multidrug resistance operon repressor
VRTRDIDKQDLVKKMTIEMVVKYGLEGFTIAKLAKACGISVGTPYVYYKDKDDLIVNIALDEGKKLYEAMNRDFDPDAFFEEGLRTQWRNRADYTIAHPMSGRFLDQIRCSTYYEQLLDMFTDQKNNFVSKFRQNVLLFVANSVERKEIDEMPFEEFWCIAFAPLYALLRFNQEGRGSLGHPFELNEKMLWATFDRVVRLVKN